MSDCYFCSLCAYCFSFNDFTRRPENMLFICPRSCLVTWQNLMRCGPALDSRSFCVKCEMKERIFQIFCVFPFWRKLLNVFWVDSVVFGRDHPVVLFSIHKLFYSKKKHTNLYNTYFWLHVSYYQTTLRPVFIIRSYIQCAYYCQQYGIP